MSTEPLEDLKKIMNTSGEIASVEKILDKLLVSDKNLILKTDIENTRNFVMLCVIQKDMENKGLKKSAKTLSVFLDMYIKARVSNSRLSRKEVLDAISAIRKEANNSITSQLLGVNDKEKK